MCKGDLRNVVESGRFCVKTQPENGENSCASELFNDCFRNIIKARKKQTSLGKKL